MFLNQLSIAKRLACVLGLILSLSLLTSLFAVFKLQQMGEVTDAMLAVNLKTERAAADWLRNTTAGVQRAAAIAKSSDPSLVEYFAPATAAAISETNELQKYVESQMVTPEQKALNDKVSELRKGYLSAREEVNKLKKAGDPDGAAKALPSVLNLRPAATWLLCRKWPQASVPSWTLPPSAMTTCVRKPACCWWCAA